jgi:carbamoyl-phosphate synthase large subunit
MIESIGIPVRLITKKLNEGSPNVVDVINDGSVQGVINTVTGGRIPLKDGFHIRRAAAEKRIPCFTSLDTALAAIDVLGGQSKMYNVKPVRNYLSDVVSA